MRKAQAIYHTLLLFKCSFFFSLQTSYPETKCFYTVKLSSHIQQPKHRPSAYSDLLAISFLTDWTYSSSNIPKYSLDFHWRFLHFDVFNVHIWSAYTDQNLFGVCGTIPLRSVRFFKIWDAIQVPGSFSAMKIFYSAFSLDSGLYLQDLYMTTLFSILNKYLIYWTGPPKFISVNFTYAGYMLSSHNHN